MELRSFEIQSKIVRNGRNAAEITLKTGDIVEPATNKNKSSERDELMESHSLYSVEGIKYEYQFRMFCQTVFPSFQCDLLLLNGNNIAYYPLVRSIVQFLQ